MDLKILKLKLPEAEPLNPLNQNLKLALKNLRFIPKN